MAPRRRALLALNHVRIPLALSALLLLISLPLVLELDPERYSSTLGGGLTLDRYLGNWLLITAALFATSGLLYALALRGRGSRRPMLMRESRRPPIEPPGRVARIAARATLGALWLVALWVAALAIYGVLNASPL